jgi:co-chaperonin GroES (HSP10)
MPAALMMHEVDPRQALLDKIGDLDWFDIANNDVLVATYKRPDRTASGFYLPESNLREDIHQGKASLVLKIGKSCDFPTIDIKPHDWVMIRPSDGWHIQLTHGKDPIDCRLICDKFIRARVTDPDRIW